ncbi:uncharacterized protein HKW66_Vig0075960 [Vigna angularis]|uniref:Uncharacterized protein n=1 Tax=Phaseolus angularis TaxID=3914 RepID=A0A8T0K6Z4_PHAAN|nr:uncharacterized protein HKW66_Vig0075960 [Vigna angularis]
MLDLRVLHWLSAVIDIVSPNLKERLCRVNERACPSVYKIGVHFAIGKFEGVDRFKDKIESLATTFSLSNNINPVKYHDWPRDMMTNDDKRIVGILDQLPPQLTTKKIVNVLVSSHPRTDFGGSSAVVDVQSTMVELCLPGKMKREMSSTEQPLIEESTERYFGSTLVKETDEREKMEAELFELKSKMFDLSIDEGNLEKELSSSLNSWKNRCFQAKEKERSVRHELMDMSVAHVEEKHAWEKTSLELVELQQYILVEHEEGFHKVFWQAALLFDILANERFDVKNDVYKKSLVSINDIPEVDVVPLTEEGGRAKENGNDNHTLLVAILPPGVEAVNGKRKEPSKPTQRYSFKRSGEEPLVDNGVFAIPSTKGFQCVLEAVIMVLIVGTSVGFYWDRPRLCRVEVHIVVMTEMPLLQCHLDHLPCCFASEQIHNGLVVTNLEPPSLEAFLATRTGNNVQEWLILWKSHGKWQLLFMEIPADRVKYEATAPSWTQKYAMDDNSPPVAAQSCSEETKDAFHEILSLLVSETEPW